MFVKISALFSIFQLILVVASTNDFDSTDSKILPVASKTYDDISLAVVQQRLDLLQMMNENLRLKIDSLEMILIQQLTKQRNELNKDFAELKTILTSTTQKYSIKSGDSGKPIDQESSKYFYENLIDIRAELNQQLMKQKTVLNKDLEVLNAAIATQKKSNQSTDSEKANRTDIRGKFTNENQNIYQFENFTKPATAMQSLPSFCDEALNKSGHSGIYKIEVLGSGLEPFNVYCLGEDEGTDDTDSTNYTSGWLVIQRRQDGSIDFYRNYTDYQNGFGKLEGEFFIGLDKLHALTQSAFHELWIQMEDFEGEKRWAKYSSFAIGGENETYILNLLEDYTGNAGDSLSSQKGMKWSTFDFDNDMHPNYNCAQSFTGAWWYNDCHDSNLNGQYLRGSYGEDKTGKGIEWYTWQNHYYSLKYVHMAIRPVQYEGY